MTLADKVTNNESVYKEGALKITKMTPAEVTFTVIGAVIGSGCLGTAYASRLAGWPVIALWFILAGFLTVCSMLYVAETSLRTKNLVQLPGLAERYVGKVGSIIIFASVAVNSIGCLIAYFNGSGDILAQMLGVSREIGMIIFLIPAVGVSWFGLKATGAGAKLLSIGMITLLVVLCIASFLSDKVDVNNVVFVNWRFAVPLFSVAAFSYIGQYLVPDLVRGMSHDPKKLAPAIVKGMVISAVLLIMIPLSVMLINKPDEITQVATLSWGQALGDWAFFTSNIFALIAMLTSYWAIKTTFVTNVVDVLKLKSEWDIKTRVVITAVIVAIPLYLSMGGLVGFVDAIWAAGTFGGVVMAIIPVMMLRSSRKTGDIDPEWKCGWYSHAFFQWALIIIYSSVAVYAVFGMLGYLPAGW
ncbi:aromatic amino acid transport family protein [Wukongibacter baidiensis]|uniref:aromatic amino acid transport family protein n=1 Tax=Wukongibacter baidiensis TaxID=1723361 RepID=UPI003D7F67A7